MASCGILIFQNSAQFGQEVNITAVTRDKPALILGSDARAHVQIADAEVGASHAAISAWDGGYRIKPTLPAMQVFVNNRLVERTQSLNAGDVIRVGTTELYFDLAERDLPTPAPRVYKQPVTLPTVVMTQPAVYQPAAQQATATTTPIVMVAGVVAILSVISALAYLMIFNPVGLNTLITGRVPIVYSPDAVTLVMFEASWCTYCKQQKPIVSGLEREYDGMLQVRHVDIDSPRNRQLVEEYQATSIPLMVLFNKSGDVVKVYRGLTKAGTLIEGVEAALKIG